MLGKKMTQVESKKEEDDGLISISAYLSDSSSSTYNGDKVLCEETNNSSNVVTIPEEEDCPQQRNQKYNRDSNNDSVRTFKIYRNGDAGNPHEYTADLSDLGTWSQALELLTSATSSKTREGFIVTKVFTTEGKKLASLSDLTSCRDIVICGSEAYQKVIYGSPLADSVNTRRYVVSKFSKMKRADRNVITKSAIFEPEEPANSHIEQMTQSQVNRRSPLVKTFSEQDVSNFEHPSMTESISPKLRPRNTQSPKPRPMSAYHQVASVHGVGRRSPLIGVMSRIPKRIIAGTNNINRGSSSNADPSTNSFSPVTYALSNNNINNRNCSRRNVESKVTSSERTSRHDATRLEFIRPRLITVVRHGMKPRKAVRFLLNKKTARSYDQVLTDITESIKPDWGAVRRVYTLNGAQVDSLEDFFGTEDIFLACANDRVNPEDFELDFEECKAIQPYVKATLVHKHSRTSRGIESKSPLRKTCKAGVLSTPSPQITGTSHPKNIPLSHFPAPILNKYEVGGIIGDGNFAVVRDCTDRKSKKKYALKVIDKSKCSGRDVPPEHEIAILTTVNHTNIVVLYEQYDFSNELYVVMELVEGGDLFDAIADVTKFSEKESRSMTNDIASALDYLHNRNIVHRDIKPENLLVYFQNNGQRRIKVGDFGLAQIVTGPMYTVCGTPTYVAPEILTETGYGLKVDIWALGVIVYVLLCGYPPFVSPTGDQEDLFDLILAGELEFHREHWSTVSEDAKDIISRMIEADSDARLSADEVLHHPWLATNSIERDERRRKMFQRDFRLSVFEAMGLSALDPHKDSSLP